MKENISNEKQNEQSCKTGVSGSALTEKAKYIIAKIYELSLDKSSFELDKATDAMYDFISKEK